MEAAWKRMRTPIQPAGATGIASVAIPDPKLPKNARSVMKAEAVCWSTRGSGLPFTTVSAIRPTATSATSRKATHRGSPSRPAHRRPEKALTDGLYLLPCGGRTIGLHVELKRLDPACPTHVGDNRARDG